ncbi:MAG TPA: sensor histidine kinase [Thermoanaerobaculia bacterium]|jgi:signal transduction histidine kinase
MKAHVSPRQRAERLIAGGRVALAASAFFAVWLDPSEPAKYAAVAYGLLAAYNVYSALIALVAWRRGRLPRRQGLVTHVFDLAFFSSFIFFTAGPSSPFNAYFVFSLVCATLRWRQRGTLWTALAALAAYLVFGLAFAGEPGFELHPFIIRGVYMGVMAVLLANLGAHEQWMRLEMTLLAASEERNRVARDLHDGVLQSLTGIGLRLAAVRRQLDHDPPAAREQLEELQRLIALEQRDLRFYLQDIKPPPLTAAGESPGLAARMAELVRRLELEWGLAVVLRAEGLDEGIPDALTHDLYHIVREALVNAARHGEASRVAVEIARRDGALAIRVADDGHGFPIHGVYTQEELAARYLEPKSLGERVRSLGGRFTVDSRVSGARLEILLPLEGALT